MRILSLATRLYVFVTVIGTIFLLLFTILHLHAKFEYFKDRKYGELMAVATDMESRLDGTNLAQRIIEVRNLSLSTEEKVQLLHQEFQPFVSQAVIRNPGYNIGIFVPGFQSIIATTPDQETQVFSPSELNDRIYNVYHMGEPGMVAFPESSTCSSHGFRLAYPVYDQNGDVIAYVGVSVKLDKFSQELWLISDRIIGLAITAWLFALGLIYLAIRRLQQSVYQLASNIAADNEDIYLSSQQLLPELLPVCTEVAALRKRLSAKNEEILHLDRLNIVGQMAASVAHEIRNPMTTVRGFIQLLAKKSEDSSITYYDLILSELDRINVIITDFLSLSRNRVTDKSLCQVNELIDEMLPLISAETLKRAQHLDITLSPELLPVHINKSQFKQLLLNLCINGMDAMHADGTLKIETRQQNHQLSIHITDCGCGIPSEMLEKIFQPFYTTKGNGTGLGLSVCASIVEQHDGHISVSSEVGVGTQFSIFLPIPQPPDVT